MEILLRINSFLSSIHPMDMEEAAPFPRASFFLASRLASVVQKFRHRLQKKVQQKKKSPNPFGVSYHRGIRLRALSDLEK